MRRLAAWLSLAMLPALAAWGQEAPVQAPVQVPVEATVEVPGNATPVVAEPVLQPATRSGREIYRTFREGLADPDCSGEHSSARWRRHYAAAPRRMANGSDDVLALFGYVVDAVREAGLPTEYALIPFVESGYKPGARSAQGPAGMWQMIRLTARAHHVPIHAGYDGRLSPVESTRAAVRYLKTLHGMFAGDWRLAAMAYNAGEYRVLSALRRSRQVARSADPEKLTTLSGITRAYVRKLHALSCLFDEVDEGEQWLLVHKRDPDAVTGWDAEDHPQSVKSGRTNDQVKDGVPAIWDSSKPPAEALIDLSGAVEAPLPGFIPPMLATSVDAPFSDDDWLFEMKLDGYRVEAVVANGTVRLWTRNHNDAAHYFPELAATRPTWISATNAIVDGEVVAKGAPQTKIAVPDVAGLRPTPDRVRETLFNWLGQELGGRSCLDLFAGTGALGLEAASRGAAQVVLVERDRRAAAAIATTLERLRAPGVRLVVGDAFDALHRLAQAGERFDVVFVDPPFDQALHARTLAALDPVLAADAVVYVESGAAFDAPGGWHIEREGRAGQVRYHLLSRHADASPGHDA